MQLEIVTIGVYGFDKDRFFQALIDAHVDTLCDIRRRRGMRGSEYAFANSMALQKKLRELGIRYMNVKDLAPGKTIRDKQKQEDKKFGIAKRSRKELGQTFVQEYEQQCLVFFDTHKFVDTLGSEARVVGLCCVEREPEACHRSLVAKKLADELKLQVRNITP